LDSLVDGVFLEASEAYARLGVYGGDDGLTAMVAPLVYKRAASTVGQELTVEPVVRGKLGVKFLARVYGPDVWFGDLNNCCDLPRLLSKIHVTVNLPSNITPQMKLLEKVRSYVLSDENTPIVGTFCKAVIALHGTEFKIIPGTEPMRTWLSRYDKKDQYPNVPAEWMLSYAELSLPDFDYKRFNAWAAAATSYDYLLKPPMFTPPPLLTLGFRLLLMVKCSLVVHQSVLSRNAITENQI